MVKEKLMEKIKTINVMPYIVEDPKTDALAGHLVLSQITHFIFFKEEVQITHSSRSVTLLKNNPETREFLERYFDFS